ncbi:MAG: hypothetical protein LUQ38_06335 [Methanotrichaceae archaeon]|nr:hypothetical protein [Methanotrichaceae archaeon]
MIDPVDTFGKESDGPPPALNSATSLPKAPLAQKVMRVEFDRLQPGSLPVLESGYCQQMLAKPLQLKCSQLIFAKYRLLGLNLAGLIFSINS